jgi:hypothetical protein
LITARRPADRRGNRVARGDRLCRARTGHSVAPTVWAHRVLLPAAGRGAASLNSRLASNLQQAIIHTHSSAERAEPGRAGAHPVPRGGSDRRWARFRGGLGSASLCRQARCPAGRTCQPVRRRHRARQRSGGNRPAHRHPRCCLGWGTRPAGRRDKLITARRCRPAPPARPSPAARCSHRCRCRRRSRRRPRRSRGRSWIGSAGEGPAVQAGPPDDRPYS